MDPVWWWIAMLFLVPAALGFAVAVLVRNVLWRVALGGVYVVGGWFLIAPFTCEGEFCGLFAVVAGLIALAGWGAGLALGRLLRSSLLHRR